ncbi:hypothetical protein pqer_cds_219 [Pandoravirus quercus]|uniref:Uncharacterized protein n=1 Tax=Pandoravirus quercus TaxID=2107709 RepID=A0A2U7U877_9VIRU|nr:hypothetical protein pqer_cds_219 [Pandoravirus quercus]AVK74641.1 hypothetical protein pqer_cds_219 [Pandoravirus quercus]
MQRDELPTGGADGSAAAPVAYFADGYSGEVAGYYLGPTYSISQGLFEASVPAERRVVLVDTTSDDATAYDAANLINQMARSDFQDSEGQPYWLKSPPGPWLFIDDDSHRRIIQRARRLLMPSLVFPDEDEDMVGARTPASARAPAGAPVAPSAAPVAEPSQSVYVRDPTPSCAILPSGSAYTEVYDFYDPSIDRDEFEREVPPARRVVLRSGNSTIAYDAAQLLLATKGVAGNWERAPAQRTYVLSTATGSCIFDRGAYEDLVRRSTAVGDDGQEAVTEEEEEEEEIQVPLAPRPAAREPLAPTPRLRPSAAPRAPVRRPPQQPQPGRAATTTVFARPTPQPQIASVTRPGRLPERGPMLAPVTRRALPLVVQAQPPQRPQTAAPSIDASVVARIDEAVRGAHQGALVRFIASPGFAADMRASRAADYLGDALARDFVRGTDPLPIALTSLATRSLGVPDVSQIVDAATIVGLVRHGALGSIAALQRAGFDPSDSAVIRSILVLLSGPAPDVGSVINVIDALPPRDRAGYLSVLTAAARLGSRPVALYITESVLRDAPISPDEAAVLANTADQAGQRAIASFFRSQAEPLGPVPVSADYREREREYRGVL